MSRVTATAEGAAGFYAAATADGRISVWSTPDEPPVEFQVSIAEGRAAATSRRLAIVSPRHGESQVVVGSWTGGVAAFSPEGERLWHRRDIRNIQQVRSIPMVDGLKALPGIVVERGPALILGPTGGTKHRCANTRFMAGGANGSLLTQDRTGRLLLRHGPDAEPSWITEPGPVVILDAVVGLDTLVCGARSRLRLIDSVGTQQWATPAKEDSLITCLHADPAGAGWICLDVTPGGRAQSSRVLRITRDGEMTILLEIAGSWIGFVNNGRNLVAEDGTIMSIADPLFAP